MSERDTVKKLGMNYRQYKCDVTLDTPLGERKYNAYIVCNEEDMCYQGELIKEPSVNVCIKYEGNEVWGRGKDCLWIDAFADLQNKLPQNAKLKCCLVCKHGNMCPSGNCPDELFCTKDVVITQKSDLFFYTEDKAERDKRLRKYTDVCESFELQSENCFIYNDWLDYLGE